MPTKTPLRDIIIVVPGIMGSQLQRDGRDLWVPSAQAASSLLFRYHETLETLTLHHDSATAEVLDDGVRASALMDDIRTPFFGLFKVVDGYTGLRQMIHNNFKIIGNYQNDEPTNYIEFPYDWRRDIRHASWRLKQLIEQKLALWREKKNTQGRVIIIGHSLGGLVSRYYLEKLGGAADCKALFTLGTPHRGAVYASNVLIHGYQIPTPIGSFSPVVASPTPSAVSPPCNR